MVNKDSGEGRPIESRELTASPAGEKEKVMSAGSGRIIRYVLFAFVVSSVLWLFNIQGLILSQGILVVYFISSSQIPTPPLPTSTDFAKWKGRKDKGNANPSSSGPAGRIPLASDHEKILAPQPVSPEANSSLNNFSPQVPAKMNATFVTLARNSDLWDIIESIRQVEDRFNRNYHYDWVFLNDKPFEEDFKKVTTALISGKTKYGLIPKEHWSFPDFIDQEKAKKVREDMSRRKIIYGDSVSYRHMCRFESGFFFRQPLMNDYEWYWRVEPSIKLFCDVGFDPFRFMAENKKKYSFVISIYEYVETIPTLWDSAKKFIKNYPEHIAHDNSMEWLSDDDGDTYNHCHFVISPNLSP